MECHTICAGGGKRARLCPEIVNALETSIICCQMDEVLSFLWGNVSFFRKIHFHPDEYHRLFPSLKQYFAGYFEEFSLIRRALSQARESGDPAIRLTIRLPLKEGGFFWTLLTGKVIDSSCADGPVFQAEFADVSALMAEKEEQSRLYLQKQQYFTWMMDTYNGNVYISDMDTYELLYVNQNSCETLHTHADKVLGRKCYEVIQGRSTPCPFCTNEKLREDTFYEWEFDNPVLEKTFLIKNRIIEWQGRRARIELSHDMFSTEYKLAKKDQERDALIRSVNGGFARVDARDMKTILWYGGGFLDLIGYTKDSFEKELHSQCTYVHPEDIDHAVSVMRQSMETGAPTAVESRVVTQDGTIKLLTLTFSFVGAESSWDGIPSFYSMGLDVTKERLEQARQRQALEDACKAAQIANDAKTNFLSSMSHDIRTPMNAIIGMSVIAQANLYAPEKMQDCLDKINTASRHLLNLINEVLDMSKIESGKVDLTPEEVFLPDLIEDVMNVFRPLAAEKQQALQVNADHVRHERVVTDGGRLQQVLVNLLSNAVKYTPEGGTVSLRIQEIPSFSKGKGQYSFVVTDSGIGMSGNFIPHIFEPFSRAEDAKIAQVQGTGLGMAITQNIVRMMNGTIEVKSTLGKGSQFIVAVSFDLCEEAEMDHEELSGLPVLVVDDDPIICESASEILDELGMRSSWVLSGREAVSRIVAAQKAGDGFFSVILDWMMPDMDGLETLRQIRKNVGLDVPIIIVSAYDYSDIEEEFRLAGADAFITKPLFKSKIVHTLHQFCQNSHFVAQAVPYERRHTSLNGSKLLLVEDNELNREIAVELLQMHSIMADTAENGQIAVEKFAASMPGEYVCILMDIQMPVMDGYTSAMTIRSLKHKDAKTVPILALTANAFSSDIGKAHSAGMNDHISKPIDMERLLETLQRWVE